MECSTGTYVRALARDLGAALGVGGHLTALRRTRVGVFTVDEAQTLDEAEDTLKLPPLDVAARRCFATLTVTVANRIRDGARIGGLILPATPTALFTEAGLFLALYRQEEADSVAEAVFV